jgi:SAM-dependent methyltransferase
MMPAESESYWAGRAEAGEGATWYMDRWKDLYAKALIRFCVRRFLPGLVGRGGLVLDVGCGDGWLSRWMAARLGVKVVGVELFDYGVDPKPSESVRLCFGVDIEELAWWCKKEKLEPDCAVVSSVLECTSDWRKALREILKSCGKVLLFEDLRLWPAPYQAGRSYKSVITWPDFLLELNATAKELKGDVEIRSHVGNVLDRVLFVRTPRFLWPPVSVVTLAADLGFHFLGEVFPAVKRRSRFRVVVLSRG